MKIPTPFIRLIDLATAIGGIMWAVASAVIASRPPGIPGGDYRQTDDLAPYVLTALLLITLGLAGLYARRGKRAGRLAPVGFGLSMTGVTLLIAGSLILPFGGDTAFTPFLIVPGVLSLILGAVVSVVAAARSGLLPYWAATVLIGTSLLLLPFNSEDDRAWFAVPFGLAWAVVSCAQALSRRTDRYAFA